MGVGLFKDEQGTVVSLRVHLPERPDAATERRILDALRGHVAQPEPPPLTLAHPRLEQLRAKRRSGALLTLAEQEEALDLLLGV